MVSKEEQLEFEFMTNRPDQKYSFGIPLKEEPEKQESYYAYIKRMYRETEERDANL